MLTSFYAGRAMAVAATVLSVAALPVPACSEALPALAILPIRMLDTSGEPQDKTAEHAARRAAMGDALSAHLAPRHRVVGVTEQTLDSACPDQAPGCILATARDSGAEIAFVGVVHKSSTLIMQMFARIVDTRSGTTLFSRELNFRGDNTESWQRAENFLSQQIVADPPRSK